MYQNLKTVFQIGGRIFHFHQPMISILMIKLFGIGIDFVGDLIPHTINFVV